MTLKLFCLKIYNQVLFQENSKHGLPCQAQFQNKYFNAVSGRKIFAAVQPIGKNFLEESMQKSPVFLACFQSQ